MACADGQTHVPVTRGYEAQEPDLEDVLLMLTAARLKLPLLERPRASGPAAASASLAAFTASSLLYLLAW